MLRSAALAFVLVPLATPSSPARAPRDFSADTATLEATLDALYDVISGPAGEKRDWERFHHLFLPEGSRLMPLGAGSTDRAAIQVLEPKDYVERSAAFLEERGFFETEIHRVVERYGRMAHVFSTYEARFEEDGPVRLRGINSIQLLFDRDRWWVVSIYWEPESEAHPLPEQYLPARK